ncbi:hypothetical protein Hdeb2414_s0002g00059321 [Helianthus debilis subsp. tardiflorus]
MKLPTDQRWESVKELVQSVNGMDILTSYKKIVHAIVSLTLWTIWSARNRKRFEGKEVGLYKLVADIKEKELSILTRANGEVS